MRFAEVTREITVNVKARARRNSWPIHKVIGSGFNINDLLQQRCIIITSNPNSEPNLYHPTKDDIMANDWVLLNNS